MQYLAYKLIAILIGVALIEKEIENISRDDIKELVRANLKKIEEGERDFRL